MKNFRNTVLVAILIPLCLGCGQKDKGKTLQEIKEETLKGQANVSKGSMAGMDAANPHAGMDMSKGSGMMVQEEQTAVDQVLSWTVPDGFKEMPAGGMRLATLNKADEPEAVDISIVTLSLMASNVPANLVRWAGQLGLSLDNTKMDQFIKSAQRIDTLSGAQGWVFDFTILQKDADAKSTKSMIASMVEMQGFVVFLKMTGFVEDVLKNKEAFGSLTASIDVKR